MRTRSSSRRSTSTRPAGSPCSGNSMIRSISNYKKRFARPRFMSGPQGRMWLVPRPFCHVTVILSDEAAARKEAGLKAEAPRPLVKKRQGRVAAAVSAAAARPKAANRGRRATTEPAQAAEAHAEPQGRKREAAKSKKPSPSRTRPSNGVNDGSESPPLRFPHRLQPDLALALVRREGLPQVPARRHQAPRGAQARPRATRRCPRSRSSAGTS